MWASLVVAAALVSEASLTEVAGTLVVRIETQPAVPASQVHATVDERGVLLVIDDADLALAEQRFGTPPRELKGRRAGTGVSLEAPFATARTCGAPDVRPTPTGVEVTSRCDAPAPAREWWNSSTAAIFPLIILAAAGLSVARWRKKTLSDGLVEIMETHAIGPKRSLLVVRMGRERLLLGSSEGGITLLATRPDILEPSPKLTATNVRAPLPPSDESFADALQASTEDEELRHKLGLRRSDA